MTVADLIARLMELDPSMEVSMSMNMEYECAVEPEFITVVDYDGVDRLVIGSLRWLLRGTQHDSGRTQDGSA